MSTTSWADTLDDAAGRFDGGLRSFPPAADARHTLYEPPNEDYAKLFLRIRKTAQSRCASSAGTRCSAGWLLPDDQSICNPVFVAHSALSAVWLLRSTLGDAALPTAAWKSLTDAAADMARASTAAEEEEESGSEDERADEAADETTTTTKAPTAVEEEEETGPENKRADEAADETLDRPFSGKRTASPRAPRSSKRVRPSEPDVPAPSNNASQGEYGTPFDEGGGEVVMPVVAAADTQPAVEPAADTPPVLVSTVTNNNRAAEKRRVAKREEAKAERKRSNGLVPPPAAAPRREHGAYAAMAEQDETAVAWLLKQSVAGTDFVHSVGAPYTVAMGMLDRARAVGNSASMRTAAAFLHSWRSLGSPFAVEGPLSSAPSGRGASQGGLDATSSAWRLCDRYELELDVMHIKYRWSLAFLGQKYAAHVDRIASRDRGPGHGKASTQAQHELLREAGITPTQAPAAQVRKRLHQAKRWFMAVQRLGWGMLCFMPHDVITNSWVENDLRVEVWGLWLELVDKVNPVATSASRAIDSWIGSAPDGSISDRKTLSLEVSAALSSQVEEVPDSEESEEESEGENREGREGVESGKELVKPPMRQLTLFELCQPR
jgi:hypothetical protein